MIGGWVALTSWGILKGVFESDSLFLIISFVAAWLGIFILLVWSLIQKKEESRNDPYKDVLR